MTTCHGYKGGPQGPRVTSILKLPVLTKAKLKTKTKMKKRDGKEEKEEG